MTETVEHLILAELNRFDMGSSRMLGMMYVGYGSNLDPQGLVEILR